MGYKVRFVAHYFFAFFLDVAYNISPIFEYYLP